VLDSMAKAGHITPVEADAAKKTPLALNVVNLPNNCSAVSQSHNDWGFFCDYFRTWWDSQPQFGTTKADRDQNLQEGGYTIVTSLDPNIQAEALKQTTSVYDFGNQKAAPMAVVQPGTGRVLAMAVNRHYSLAANPGGKKYPNSVDPLISGGDGASGYQAGSTFKMFTMLAALSQGKTLDTPFNAPAAYQTKWRDNGPGNCNGFYCPANANPDWMDGPQTMWSAFGRSVNTYFVWLEEQVGPQNAIKMAQSLGIVFRAKKDADLAKNNGAGWGSFTLGVALTTPLDLANAYATVGANGVYCSPLPVNSITDSTGKSIDVANPRCHQAIPAQLAEAATDAARCPVGQQSQLGAECTGGTAQQVSGIVGRPIAGKTGSSEDSSTETFVGFNAQVAAAGIAVDPNNPNDHVGAAIQQQVINGIAHIIATTLGPLPAKDFTAPPRSMAFAGG
jgi:membrane peptidoglycan carboxypeptidase